MKESLTGHVPSVDNPADICMKVVPGGANRKHLICKALHDLYKAVTCWEMFINKNLWMDIYGCILLRGLKTGYHAQNSNKYVADSVIRMQI